MIRQVLLKDISMSFLFCLESQANLPDYKAMNDILYSKHLFLPHWRNSEVSIFYFANLNSIPTSDPQIKGEQSENCIRRTQRLEELWRTQLIGLLVYLISILHPTKAPMSEENEKPVW